MLEARLNQASILKKLLDGPSARLLPLDHLAPPTALTIVPQRPARLALSRQGARSGCKL